MHDAREKHQKYLEYLDEKWKLYDDLTSSESNGNNCRTPIQDKQSRQ
jgi:hypothetical protein